MTVTPRPPRAKDLAVNRGSLPQVGRRFGGYDLQRLLGRGGMGAVFLGARDGQQVAIKVLTGAVSPEDRLRFLREGRATAALDHHPAVVPIHRVGEDGGRPFLVLAYIEGSTLNELFSKRGRLPEDEALELLRPVISACALAHDSGIVHRDLKAANILIRERDGAPLVTDFGLCRDDREATLTQTGASLGTPFAMAPEQFEGARCTPATDVWALGVLLFEALTGRRPFLGGTAVELGMAITQRPHPDPRELGVSEGLSAVLDRALSKDPARRYADAGALLEALRAPVATTTRRPALLLGAVIAGLLGGGAALWASNRLVRPNNHAIRQSLEALEPELRWARDRRVSLLVGPELLRVSGLSSPEIEAEQLRLRALRERVESLRGELEAVAAKAQLNLESLCPGWERVCFAVEPRDNPDLAPFVEVLKAEGSDKRMAAAEAGLSGDFVTSAGMALLLAVEREMGGESLAAWQACRLAMAAAPLESQRRALERVLLPRALAETLAAREMNGELLDIWSGYARSQPGEVVRLVDELRAEASDWEALLPFYRKAQVRCPELPDAIVPLEVVREQVAERWGEFKDPSEPTRLLMLVNGAGRGEEIRPLLDMIDERSLAVVVVELGDGEWSEARFWLGYEACRAGILFGGLPSAALRSYHERGDLERFLSGAPKDPWLRFCCGIVPDRPGVFDPDTHALIGSPELVAAFIEESVTKVEHLDACLEDARVNGEVRSQALMVRASLRLDIALAQGRRREERLELDAQIREELELALAGAPSAPDDALRTLLFVADTFEAKLECLRTLRAAVEDRWERSQKANHANDPYWILAEGRPLAWAMAPMPPDVYKGAREFIAREESRLAKGGAVTEPSEAPK